MINKLIEDSHINMPSIVVVESPHSSTHMNREIIYNEDDLFLTEENYKIVIGGIRNFIDNKDWYIRRRVAYRESYLLTGPPGTGKSTLIRAIADIFAFDITIITISAASSNFESVLMNRLSDNRLNFVVIEDIDSISAMGNRSSDKFKGDTVEDAMIDRCMKYAVSNGLFITGSVNFKALQEWSSLYPRHIREAARKLYDAKERVPETLPEITIDGILEESESVPTDPYSMFNSSLSEILNALDGITAPSNVIFMFTTNHPEKLDPALKRKGRINHMVEVGYLNRALVNKFVNVRFDVPEMLGETEEVCLPICELQFLYKMHYGNYESFKEEFFKKYVSNS